MAAGSPGVATSARMPNAHDLPSPDAAAAAAAAALAQHGVPFQQGVTVQVTFQGDEGGGASFAATSHNRSVRAGGGAAATDVGGAAATDGGGAAATARNTAQAHANANTNGTTDAGAPPPAAPRPVPGQVQQHSAAGTQFTCFTSTQVQILTPEACGNKASTRRRRGR